MAIVKSELIKQIKKSYPNFLTRDLSKLIDIILNEIKNSLKRGEGVELRGFGTFRTNIQKESIRRNPKTGAKVNVPGYAGIAPGLEVDPLKAFATLSSTRVGPLTRELHTLPLLRLPLIFGDTAAAPDVTFD